MRGRKAEAIRYWCHAVAQCEYTALDYSGHGEPLHLPPPPSLSSSTELLRPKENEQQKKQQHIHHLTKEATVGRWV